MSPSNADRLAGTDSSARSCLSGGDGDGGQLGGSLRLGGGAAASQSRAQAVGAQGEGFIIVIPVLRRGRHRCAAVPEMVFLYANEYH